MKWMIVVTIFSYLCNNCFDSKVCNTQTFAFFAEKDQMAICFHNVISINAYGIIPSMTYSINWFDGSWCRYTETRTCNPSAQCDPSVTGVAFSFNLNNFASWCSKVSIWSWIERSQSLLLNDSYNNEFDQGIAILQGILLCHVVSIIVDQK